MMLHMFTLPCCEAAIFGLTISLLTKVLLVFCNKLSGPWVFSDFCCLCSSYFESLKLVEHSLMPKNRIIVLLRYTQGRLLARRAPWHPVDRRWWFFFFFVWCLINCLFEQVLLIAHFGHTLFKFCLKACYKERQNV